MRTFYIQVGIVASMMMSVWCRPTIGGFIDETLGEGRQGNVLNTIISTKQPKKIQQPQNVIYPSELAAGPGGLPAGLTQLPTGAGQPTTIIIQEAPAAVKPKGEDEEEDKDDDDAKEDKDDDDSKEDKDDDEKDDEKEEDEKDDEKDEDENEDEEEEDEDEEEEDEDEDDD